MVETKIKAHEVLYVMEGDIRFQERPKNEWIPVYNSQYFTAVRILKEKGYALDNDDEFLLDNCVIKVRESPSFHGHSTKLIDIFSENKLDIKGLVKRLGLPLPR